MLRRSADWDVFSLSLQMLQTKEKPAVHKALLISGQSAYLHGIDSLSLCHVGGARADFSMLEAYTIAGWKSLRNEHNLCTQTETSGRISLSLTSLANSTGRVACSSKSARVECLPLQMCGRTRN